jgi:hypothetical protein
LRRCQDHQRFLNSRHSANDFRWLGGSAVACYRQRSNKCYGTLWWTLRHRWQRTLPPNQATVMAYTTTEPDYTLRVTIEYEDETGYQWRRTNTSQP